ncbi:hypothetical protein QBC46DRAFT_401156 [Diplogelasinospora grovesii]|uniref:HNH nuclease domain-containing protein n=1 Tax=Diplogelasinospora grovesii TaxID=303347 RepID=A0AAN6MXQ0_9PEZI|nr:hypothetical protein QBC46DRAFT_401156 [Diplogelasinospora grovesii]
MDPTSPSPHHRHQSSLEGIICFSSEPALEAGERARARQKFYRIIDHFRAADGSRSGGCQYNRPLLIRLTYEHARSEESQDIFLRAFFQSMALSVDSENDLDFENNEQDLGSALSRFADYLLDNFFLPLRASSGKTPQPSPLIHSAIQRAQGGGVQDFVGTPERVAGLRGDCLIRDRHRCVISRRFDLEEASKRLNMNGDEAEDDDGNLLLADPKFSCLEVAHILPHSLTKIGNGSQLHPSKKAALDILNMFDSGVIHLIEGNDIDRPRNAITLTRDLHTFFGNFDVFFEPLPDQEHTYRIQSFLHPMAIQELPLERTLYLTRSRTIEPPSPRLLALHCAIAHILHLSAAGDYINKILRDLEWKDTQADGSTELGRLVALRLMWSEVHT